MDGEHGREQMTQRGCYIRKKGGQGVGQIEQADAVKEGREGNEQEGKGNGGD